MTASFSPFLIGVVAGMRALSAPALLSRHLSQSAGNPLANSRLHFLTTPNASKTLAVLAGTELLGDKAPNGPDRTTPPQLIVRLASGAVCGAAISATQGSSSRLGAVLGAAGALVGTFAFFHVRRYLTHDRGLPDTAVALLEDALTLGAGWQVANAVGVGNTSTR
ncbi:DUF4126 family protein [Fibrella sp. WM1]|uniref:DUF4126 family protein n=1 Tax=Fibrella musci TaxID=3242485 RepID=UPI003520656B